MYYDLDKDDNLQLYSKFVNPIIAIYYKLNKFYRRKFYCFECENIFVALVKKHIKKKLICPYCDE